ncbi:amidohydrolase [Nocardia transvalensis]|uniref:amidohydrolase n=1 Tax=Nocardia transvalensis TaxID=37333 RepID=UPI001892DC3C|nr:amidohydrolase [Nocardia transvalensis]MBF6330619.1 amidohydrolase [Nocardia transvalensis]
MTRAAPNLADRLEAIHGDLADLYRDLHAHPELAFGEHRTADEIARRAASFGYEVTTGVGHTGVVARLANGTGPTVLLRADMDALPVHEQTGLPYASTATDPDTGESVMHACGHDIHVTCLLGALQILAESTQSWSGTVLAVFQPAEETATGAQAMIDDGLFDRFGRPDVVLGQHVGPLPTDIVALHPGPAMAATDALRITLYGKGGHGSRPEATVDPVVLAAATVMRLQTIVSREIAGGEIAVVTVGSIKAGTRHNIISDHAELLVNIRTYTPEMRERVLRAIERIVRAEAAASGAERAPDIETLETFPTLVNDAAAVERTASAFRDAFGADKVVDPGPVTASEDCGLLATSSGAPLCYWFFGGVDPQRFAQAFAQGRGMQDIPSNHSPHFAPECDPAIDTGVTAMVTAALTWLD